MANAFYYKRRYFSADEYILECIKDGVTIPVERWYYILQEVGGSLFSWPQLSKNRPIVEPVLLAVMPELRKAYPLPPERDIIEKAAQQLPAQAAEPDLHATLAVYSMWQNNAGHKHKNIFADVTESDFLHMVETADFSKIKTNGAPKGHITYTLYKIAQLLFGKGQKQACEEWLRKCNDILQYQLGKGGVSDWRKPQNAYIYHDIFK